MKFKTLFAAFSLVCCLSAHAEPSANRVLQLCAIEDPQCKALLQQTYRNAIARPYLVRYGVPPAERRVCWGKTPPDFTTAVEMFVHVVQRSSYFCDKPASWAMIEGLSYSFPCLNGER